MPSAHRRVPTRHPANLTDAIPFTRSARLAPAAGPAAIAPTLLARAVRGALLGAALFAVWPVVSPQGAWAQAASAARAYRIAAGSLDQALNAFASAAGVALSADAALTAGKHSAGLDGRYGVADGFAALLAGQGLEAVEGANGVWSLRSASQRDALLPVVNVAAGALGGSAGGALTEGTASYTVQAATVGGKLGETLREVPRSISVITRQQLDDQRMLSLYDAVNQLSGVTTVLGGGNDEETQFYSRGFRLDTITADGLSIAARGMSDGDSRGGGSNTGMAKYDSVQLLRGPDGLFSGNGQPSGSINLVRKHATDTFQFKTALSAGSWRHYAGEADLSTPLTADGRIRGRLVAALNTSEHFYDSSRSRKSTLYGIVDADLTPDTLLSVGASRDTIHGAPDQPPGFPRYSNGKPLDIGRSAGYPDWAERSYDSDNMFATLEHRFGNDWKLKAGWSETRTRNGLNEVTYYAGAVEPGAGASAGSYVTRADWSRKVQAFDLNLTGDVSLWGRRHQLAFGADYSNARQYSMIGGVASNDPIRNQPIDWSNFDANTAIQPWNNVPSWDNVTRHKQQGAYAYGRFEVLDAWKVILGGRHARYEAWSTGWNAYPEAYGGTCPGWASSCNAPVSVKYKDNSGIFTPYYALTWDFAPQWTAYVSMAESYEDQSNYYTAAHQALDPTTGKSWELGIKGELADGRLNGNIAFYRSTRENYAVHVSDDDTFSPAGRYCCYAGDGEFLAQGVEIDISGALTPNWQINAGYTFDDNKTEYGSNDGKRYASYTPKHILRLWTSYRLHGQAAAWRVGGGVQAQSGFFNSGTVRTWNPATSKFDGPSVAYDFNEPGRAVWNAFAEYRIDRHWTAALNINNLFDKRYFQSVGTTAGGNYYGTPRSMMVTLRGAF